MRAILWVFSIVGVLYFVVWLFKDDIRDWFFPNIIEVETYGDVKADQVQISWTAEQRADTLTLFQNQKQITDDFRAQGFNTFLVYYEGRLVDSFEQFKTTAESGHHYKFMFWQKQDSVILDLKISGAEAPL